MSPGSGDHHRLAGQLEADAQHETQGLSQDGYKVYVATRESSNTRQHLLKERDLEFMSHDGNS